MSERPLPAVAALFDFDDTLCPDSTAAFLASRRVDQHDFWEKVSVRLGDGYDYCLAYLTELVERTEAGRELEGLTSEDLRRFGATLRPYEGVESFLRDLRDLGERRGVEVKLFVVSSGLREVITASPAGRLVDAVYASELGADERGVLNRIKRAVSFTEKTRYLFEVHKGLRWEDTRRNPLAVNKAVDRRVVPFERMVYVGDGLTDIPCFSLVKKFGGLGVAVEHTKLSASKAKREAQKKLASDRRVVAASPPDFGPDGALSGLLRGVVRSYVELVAAERQTTARDEGGDP